MSGYGNSRHARRTMNTKTSTQSWEFWKKIVCNPDGSLNEIQVRKELQDFLFMIENVPKVYDHITGGRISKPLTDPQCVIDEAEEHYRKCYKDEETTVTHYQNPAPTNSLRMIDEGRDV